MQQPPGSRIGSYEIVAPLGAGGMGEVYKARDTRLSRIVALKLLPDSLAADPDYIARFEREAQALAALNHPNIAQIFDLQHQAIAMEFVDGDEPRGPLPLEEVLKLATQLAEALEAAHDKGIVHRDLKPANLKVTPGGIVKVLDFGLAKTAVPAVASAVNSPTLTLRSTQAGMILGTAAYMAPEQAAGKPVDKRADIWAFGVILYELLSGRQLFQGETVSHTLASVLKDPIDLDSVNAPRPIRDLLARCLDRDVRTRLRDAGEARIAIHRFLAAPTTPAAPPPSRPRSWAAVWALSTLLAVAAVWWLNKGSADPKPTSRFTELLGAGLLLKDAEVGPSPFTGPNFVLSPDGQRFAFLAAAPGQPVRLYTRRLDEPATVTIAGSEYATTPFFSADGKWIGFAAGGKLKKAAVTGGAVFDLASGITDAMGGSWSESGVIVASFTLGGQLKVVPETGGEPRDLVKMTQPEATTQRWPQVLPGGRAVIFVEGRSARLDSAALLAYRFDSAAPSLIRKDVGFARYANGILLFLSKRVLYGARFDPRRLTILGEPVVLLQNVKYAPDSGGAQMDVSQNGTLVYRRRPQPVPSVVELVDERGAARRLPIPEDFYSGFRLSPDGRRLAVIRGADANSQLWITDLAGTNLTRISWDPGEINSPRWTADGRFIVFSSGNQMYLARSDGSRKPVPLGIPGRPNAITPDGKLLIFVSGVGVGRNCQILELGNDLDQPRPGNPQPCKGPPHAHGELSPDGKWIARYSGRDLDAQVSIRTFPDTGGQWQVPGEGGLNPLWSRTGERLFLETRQGHISVLNYAVRNGVFESQTPRLWLDRAITNGHYAVLPDGKQVLLLSPADSESQNVASVDIVLNFLAEVERALAGKGGP